MELKELLSKDSQEKLEKLKDELKEKENTSNKDTKKAS